MQSSLLVFLHVPRTGGTTLTQVLRRQYGRKRTFGIYVGPGEQSVDKQMDRFLNLSAEEVNRLSVISGHFPFGFSNSVAHADYVTVLREPVQRLVSYYYYALKNRAHYLHDWILSHRVTLAKFLLSEATPELDNYQVRLMSGMKSHDMRIRVGSGHFDAAAENLRRFRVCGVHCEYDRFLLRLQAEFGWKMPLYVPENLGPALQDRQQLDLSVQERVRANNIFDVRLYELVTKLFWDRSAETLERERVQCEKFRATNRLYGKYARTLLAPIAGVLVREFESLSWSMLRVSNYAVRGLGAATECGVHSMQERVLVASEIMSC